MHYLELFIDHAKLDQSPLGALIIRINDSTVLLFRTGKCIITGAKRRNQALHSAKLILEQLNKNDHSNARLTQFKITNLVISCKIPHIIDIEKFYNENKLHSSYEIELFPGLIFSEISKISVTIFRKGSFFVTGFSHFHRAREYTLYIFNKLYCFAIK